MLKKVSFFLLFLERITQTVEITKHTVDIEEKGVKLKLTIVDTPGFGDAVNNTEWYLKMNHLISKKMTNLIRFTGQPFCSACAVAQLLQCCLGD